MAIHPEFPKSPHDIIPHEVRWFPADESYRDSYHKLLPPLVVKIRKLVEQWRSDDYSGASPTSKALLSWWFKTPHLISGKSGPASNFQYYFAQREALETIIYLYEVANVRDKYDLFRYDSSGAVSTKMFDEDWLRLVIKMATGSGKTKVMSLVIAWCFFHKKYEPDSELATNFLVIAPNIIVLDRLRTDFDGLRIFFSDPVLPDNGYAGKNWKTDFNLTLHIQDDVSLTHKTGNIFLTNIHRVYTGTDDNPSFTDDDTMNYFLGPKPVGKTTDSKVDLGQIVREIDELVVINDEAHHVHDKSLAWFKSIQDIHFRLKQKGSFLPLQIDVTATPKHSSGAIFVQTVCDYPLVEAIEQNVVKHPVLPDEASRAKLSEKQSSVFCERYADYLKLGVEEWRKAYDEHSKLNKKAVLFVMTDDTKNCDDVADYLEKTFADLEGSVLVIHTNNNGDISEADSKKSKDELERLRKASNEIDSMTSKYKAIISVLMLKEGWDVRNVTTIVGLRAYSAEANILPEQTLGRGLRRMFPGSNVEEYVSVVGTNAFMEFVESIKNEGVTLERKPMGEGSGPKTPMIIEVDDDTSGKDIDQLDIEIPVLSPRTYREYKNLDELDPSTFTKDKHPYKKYSAEEQREIIFRDLTSGNITHVTKLEGGLPVDFRSVVGFFARTIMNDLRLVGGYDVLYGKVKEFISDYLFNTSVDLADPNTIRNLSEPEVTKTISAAFKDAINHLTIRDKGSSEIRATIKLRETRPFISNDQPFLPAKKSVFNKIIGDSNLELQFAAFLEKCPDVKSYVKNYFAINFKLDYVNNKGDISNYYPDFIVRTTDSKTYIVETKGLEDLDVPLKMERLAQWCKDVNSILGSATFDYVFVDEDSFKKYNPTSFEQLNKIFVNYR